MGLDMYLRCDEYVSGYSYQGDEARVKYEAVLEALGLTGFGAEQSPGITTEVTVAYWRKANQIHRWFVEVVQAGEDECNPHPVSREQLTQLRDLCQQAIDEKDSELLPGQEGFFFGGTEVDEWYWNGIQSTIDQLDRVLSIPEDPDRWRQFTYQSSW